MSRMQRVQRRAAAKRSRRFTRLEVPYARRSLYEQLEDRRMLTGFFNQIAEAVAGNSSAIGEIDTALHAVDTLASLPLLNKPLSQVTAVTEAFDKVQSSLYSTLNNLDPSQGQTDIQLAIFNVVSPILAPQSGTGTATAADVIIKNLTTTSIDVSFNLGYTSGQFGSALGLGINSVPFHPAANTNGAFTVGLTYQDFDFGFNTTDGAYFKTAADSALKLTVNGYLPADFTAALGFLNVNVHDNTPGTTDPKTQADLSLTISAPVTGGFGAGQSPIGLGSPELSGDVNLNTHITVQATGHGLPQVQTDMILQWTLPNVDPNSPLSGSWGAPTLAFNNVQLELGSFLGDLAAPIAQDIDSLIEPLKPMFDVLDQRIPGFSDISETLGGPQINLIEVDQLINALPASLPVPFANALNSVVKLRNEITTLDQLAASASGGWINIGNFNISGPNNSPLLSTASAILNNIGLNNWSSLIFSGSAPSLDAIKAQIVSLLPSGIGDEVNQALDELSGTSDDGGMQFTYPVITDPSSVVLGLLLGQNAQMVTFSDSMDLPEGGDYPIPIIPGLDIDVIAKIDIDMKIDVGYDTYGLREAIEPLYAGGSFDASRVLDGFYIAPDTHFHVDATFKVGPEIDLKLATLEIQGGVTGQLDATIANPSGQHGADSSGQPDGIRPFRPGDLQGTLYTVSGELDAVLTATASVGIDTPLGFIGFQKTWTFANATLFKFTTDHIDVPPSLIPPPPTSTQLFSYDATTKTLTLNAGPNAAARGTSLDVIDENFTITHVYHIQLRGLPSGPLAGPIILDQFVVSAFGVTQTLNAEVDHVYADMGSGNDTVTILDGGSPTTYEIHGGDGNDTIDVEGSVAAQLFGGTGNDTIQAGDGSSAPNAFTLVDGGDGIDTLLFGDGQLGYVNPLAVFEIVEDQNDPSIDNFTIDNSQSRVDTTYTFNRDQPAPEFGNFSFQLVISDAENNAAVNRTFYFSQANALTIYSGSGNDKFLGAPWFSTFYGGDGDDSLDMNYNSPGVLPTSLLLADPEGLNGTVRFPTVTFLGGKGDNSVTADDSATAMGGYTLSQADSGDQTATSQIVWSHAEQTGTLELGGITETHLTVAQSNSITVNGWAPGNVYLQSGSLDLNADNSMLWNTNLIIRNTPDIFVVDNNTDPTLSEAGINATGPFIDLLNGNRLQLNVDSVSNLFAFSVDYALVQLSDALMAKPWHFGFLGGATVDVADVNANPTGYAYDLTSTALKINGNYSIPMLGISTLSIDGGAGDDSLDIEGDPTTPLSMVYDGGPGDNSFTADDELNSATEVWLVRPDQVTNLLRYSVDLANVQHSQVLGGVGLNNQYVIVGDFTYPVEVDGGENSDTFTIGEDAFPATFESLMRIDGGAGDDTFTWDNVTNATAQATNSVTVVGGTGNNTLAVDHTPGSGASSYDIYSNRIKVAQNGYADWADFFYQQMGSVSIDMTDYDDTANVYGISSDILGAFLISGNGGNDQVVVHPHDAAGNPTINGNLFVNGGSGTDSVVIDNSDSSVGLPYTIRGAIGSTSVSGFGPATVATGEDIELLDLRAGSGDDSFGVQDYQDTNTKLMIEAGAGNDVLDLASDTGDLVHTIQAASQFVFDGGAGADTFNLDNYSSNVPWTYSRAGSLLFATQTGTGYSLGISPKNFENMTVNAGSDRDNFFLEALPSGQSLTLNGGAGFDTFYVEEEDSNTQEIQGQVIIDGGVNGGNLFLFDLLNTTGAMLHIDPAADGMLGGAPGDTLFGPGGSLQFHNLADDSSAEGMTLTLGSGIDTVYAGPLPTASLTINGGAPTSTTPGDQLHLALGQVQNPVQLSTGPGAGEITSSDHKNFKWFDFEQVSSDYAPSTSFLVTNTLDSGTGSLRQAILNANASPNVGTTPDVIRFAIPGVGAHTISPLSVLPNITDPVVIDATTQPGYAGKPVIELNGSLAGNSNGLAIYSGGTTIRGLDIDRFVGTPSGLIYITGPGGSVIQSNYLGTNLAGNAVYPLANQGSYGVVIFGSSGNVIGTNGDGVNDAAEGNVIAGNNTAGILIETGQPGQFANNNVIAGNRLGTSADGNTALPNGRMGVFLLGGTGNRIGTNADGVSDAAEANLISGNVEDGVYLGDSGNVVAGNIIGTNLAGTAALPNGTGVVAERSNNNVIGGTAAGSGNVIADNTSNGVWISAGTGNSVLGNSIRNNGALGIDLSASTDPSNRVTPNDPTDSDTGSNNLQNFPQITTALSSGTQTIVAGTLASTAQGTFRVEFFASPTADPSGYGEGQTFLGFVTVATDNSGSANFVARFNTVVPAGQFISATATDGSGNTSEFGPSVQVVASSSMTNVAALQVPSTGAPILVMSPANTTITASLSASSAVTPPTGMQFPFGFLNFTISGLGLGASADVTILGLNLNQVTDYFKNGATPANHTAHWYDFLYGHATDTDIAAQTGMQIVNGNVVLHLVDGQRGDDYLAANGNIADNGGPVLNQPPTAGNDSATTNKNTAVVIPVLTNDSDPDGSLNPASVAIVSAAGHGTTSINSTTGVVTYTPASNYTGLDHFTYQVKDNVGALSNVATVSIFVNAPPVANNDSVVAIKNTALTINELGNDSDSDGTLNAATVAIVTSASHGTLSVNPTTGAITYTPTLNYKGPDSFTYKVKDNLGAFSNAATVSITVDTPPAATNDSATTYKNTPVVINVLGNDSDSDGTLNATTVAIVASPGHGTLNVNPTTGAITYTPASNYTGPDSFTYKVKDNLGIDSNVATVAITVIPTGSIAGMEYLDVTGNGASVDDTPLSGVQLFLDTNNNGAWNTGEPTTTTLADGS